MVRSVVVAALPALVLLDGAAAGGQNTGSLTISDLRWDGRERPLGLIQFEPRLRWVVTAAKRGQSQTAYQVLVASEPGKLQPGRADVWDSRKVASGESINIRYGGPAPQARQRAYWTVRVWDRDDRPSAFAPAAWWEMGLYDEEWEGQWIGRRGGSAAANALDRSVTHLRKSFVLDGAVARARLYASAFGVYEISLNGRRAGEDVLAPGFTDYHKRVLFQTHDVTSMLQRGENVLGAIVAGGWCTAGLGGRAGACGLEPPRVMLQLEVTLTSGKRQVVVSDESWRARAGPILSAHLHEGEEYDARRELRGWDRPGFDDGDWQAAQQYDKEQERDLVADPGPAMAVSADVEPVRASEPLPGVHVFDLGRKIVGWTRLRTRAPAGTTITLRHAESVGPDGTIPPDRPAATDRYTARGGGTESWEPRFSVHSFRYVEVRGLTARPGPDAITGRMVHSRMPPTGRLETGHPLVDRLFAAIVGAQRAAFLSVPGAGSGRAELTGSMLEGQLVALTACLNADVQGFYRKWVDDIRDAQLPSAAYSNAAPSIDGREGGPGAGSAGVLVPWALHRCYADRSALDAHLASMGRWLNFLRAENADLVWRRHLGARRGDPQEHGPPTDQTLIATAELVHMAEALAEMARQAGPALEPEAHRYHQLAAGARAAFARTFVTADGRLTSDTQSAYALAIVLGALEGGAPRERAGSHLVRLLEGQRRRATTGLLGSAALLPALSAIGRDDLAYQLLLREECPSWLCAAGAGFPSPALAAVGAWMYDAIGGIALDPAAPAGRHVLVRPRPGGGLTRARAQLQSLHGPITTEWRRDPQRFRLRVNIPANSRATVTLPLAGRTTESGLPLEKAPGVEVRGGGRPGTTVLAIGPGSYDFLVVAGP